MNAIILIDKREKKPLEFPPDVVTLSKSLVTGDYSALGYETRLCIERKSLNDLAHTLANAYRKPNGQNERRFNHELMRMAQIVKGGGVAQVWIESTEEELFAHRYRSRISPAAILSLIAGASMAYGVPFLWKGTRSRMVRDLLGMAKCL